MSEVPTDWWYAAKLGLRERRKVNIGSFVLMKHTENRQCNTFNRTKICTPCIPSASVGVVQCFAEFPLVFAITFVCSIRGSYIYLGFLLLYRCQTFNVARVPWACFWFIPVGSFIFSNRISLDFCWSSGTEPVWVHRSGILGPAAETTQCWCTFPDHPDCVRITWLNLWFKCCVSW